MKLGEIAILVKCRLDQAQTALEDAKFLLESNRSSQAIINRCYYAMYYAALALLQNIRKVPSKHTGVISLFDTEFVLEGVFSKQLSKSFHRTFELRQKSDYGTAAPLSPEKIAEVVKATSSLC